MSTFVFPFKTHLLIPKDNGEGYDYYPNTEFAASYDYLHNARERTISVAFNIVRIEDKRSVRTVNSFFITEEGFDSPVPANYSEYSAYIRDLSQARTAKESADTRYFSAREQELLLREQYSTDPEIEADWRASKEALVSAEAQWFESNRTLEELEKSPVRLRFKKMFGYEQVLGLFDKDGSILPQALEALKDVKFPIINLPLGEIIEL